MSLEMSVTTILIACIDHIDLEALRAVAGNSDHSFLVLWLRSDIP